MLREQIEKAFRGAFAELRAALLAEMREAYTREAKALVDRTNDPKFKEPSQWNRRDYRLRQDIRYFVMVDEAKVTKALPSMDENRRFDFNVARRRDAWEWVGFNTVNKANVERAASQAVENAERSFVTKNAAKLTDVSGAYVVESIELEAALRCGVIEGTVTVIVNKRTLTAKVGLKYVLRTNPNITPYYQYPLVFVAGGKQISQEEAKALVAG